MRGLDWADKILYVFGEYGEYVDNNRKFSSPGQGEMLFQVQWNSCGIIYSLAERLPVFYVT